MHGLKLIVVHAQQAVAATRKRQSFSEGLYGSSLFRYVIGSGSAGTLSRVQECIEKEQNKPRPVSLEISANDTGGQLVTRPA